MLWPNLVNKIGPQGTDDGVMDVVIFGPLLDCLNGGLKIIVLAQNKKQPHCVTQDQGHDL